MKKVYALHFDGEKLIAYKAEFEQKNKSETVDMKEAIKALYQVTNGHPFTLCFAQNINNQYIGITTKETAKQSGIRGIGYDGLREFHPEYVPNATKGISNDIVIERIEALLGE